MGFEVRTGLKLCGMLLLLWVCGVAAACAQIGPVAPAAPMSQSAAITPPTQDDYRLGVADKVRMIVYNEPTLTGEYIVNSNGALALPLIGDVQATGRTTASLQTEIENRYRAGYLKDPHVSIEVLTFRPFYILGEVQKPGEYPYSSDLTVLNAVATAQGFTYRANEHWVYIRSPGEAKEHRYRLTSSTLVKPGDTVRIGQRYF